MNNIKNLIKKIRELEENLTWGIQHRVKTLYNETGLTPNKIIVDIVDISNIESIIHEYAVVNTSIEVKLI